MSLSPSKIELFSKVNERVCSEFKIDSEYLGIIQVESKWAEDESSRLADYSAESLEFNIRGYYEGKIYHHNNSNFSFCLSSRQGGEFYGLFIFSQEVGNLGVAGKVKYEVIGDKLGKGDFYSNNKITGLVSDKLNLYDVKSGNSTLLIVVLSSNFILLVILVFMLNNLVYSSVQKRFI